MKVLLEQIENQLASKGFFIIRDSIQLANGHQQRIFNLNDEIINIYHKKWSQDFDLLCDFTLQKEQQIIIGKRSLREIEKGQIQTDQGVFVQFESSNIKEVNVIGVYSCVAHRDSIMKDLRARINKKSKKYTSQHLENCLIGQNPSLIPLIDTKEQNHSKISKKTVSKDSLLTNKDKVNEKKVEQLPPKKLKLRQESSQSQEYYFKDKPQSKPVLVMKQQIKQLEDVEIKTSKSEALRSIQKVKQQTQLKNSKKKDSKQSRSNSIDPLKDKKQNSTSKLSQNVPKAASKKQLKQQIIQKQSAFMSNWFKKAD